MITILQHGEHEPAGAIADYLQERNLRYTIVRLYEGDELPAEIPDFLIILGGQMSANDTGAYPFLAEEKKFIGKAIGGKSSVLGICLGAQLIASALGKQVYRDTPECGWFRIRGCNTLTKSLFPEEFPVFHWHNETFDLPEGAGLLATGNTVKNQSFIIKNAVGVQFHPEITTGIVMDWTRDLHDIKKIPILRDTDTYLLEYTRFCHRLIDSFLRGWE